MSERGIQSGRVRAVTLRDVAAAAGVSVATASRAIAGVQTVAPELSGRVFAAAERLGYRMSPAARVTAGGFGSIVGLVGDETRDPYFAELADGVAQLAADRGCIVMMVGSADGDLDTVLHSLLGFQPRAIVIASRVGTVERLADDVILAQYRRDRGGVAVVGTDADWAPTITSVDAIGCTQLAEIVRSRGYCRPLIVSAPPRYPSAATRADCLRDAVSAWSGRVRVVQADAVDRDAGHRVVSRELSGSRADFDVVLAVGDMLAIGAMSALRDAGISPGDDIGITGFDDLRPARDVVPGLTTVHTGLREIGRHALHLALGDGAGVAPPPAPNVVVRDSTPWR